MAKSGLSDLTTRQRDCLRLAAESKSSKEIAIKLDISPKTVETHIAAAIVIIGAVNRRDAVEIFRQSILPKGQYKTPRQTSRLSDFGENRPSLSPQMNVGGEAQAVKSLGNETPLHAGHQWNLSAPQLQKLLDGVTPDDLTPRYRVLLIILGAVSVIFALITMMTLVDVATRVFDTH